MMKVCVYLLAFVPLVAAGLEGSYSFLDSNDLVARANPVSTDGNCASNSKVGATCQGSTFGNCCSAKGFCGDTVDYCGEGCQFNSGTCDGQAGGKQIVSTSGSCGIVGSQNVTCQEATMGDCCSEKGFCGKTSDYCSTGCQSMFGTCDDATTPSKSSSTPTPKPTSSKASSASSTPTASGSVSVDGNCGSNSAISATCLGSEFGDCCSEKGFCGGNSSYCATGCQSAFGKCSSSSSSSSSASPTPTPPSSSNSSISLDGNCGRNSANLATCLGSTFGDCCSERGYCGGNSSYCGAGCLSSWGKCGASNATTSATPVPSQILSSGAKAGIGIGCALLGVAVVGLIVWYVLRLRRKRRDGPVELDVRMGRNADADLSLVDNGGKNVPLMGWGDEKRKSERVEMDGRSVAFEMDAARGPVELSGLTKREEEERRKRLVDERVAAGYEGAYRGN